MKEFINSTRFAVISMALLVAPIFIEFGYFGSDTWFKSYLEDRPSIVGIVIHTISAIMAVLGLAGCLTVIITCIKNGTV